MSVQENTKCRCRPEMRTIPHHPPSPVWLLRVWGPAFWALVSLCCFFCCFRCCLYCLCSFYRYLCSSWCAASADPFGANSLCCCCLVLFVQLASVCAACCLLSLLFVLLFVSSAFFRGSFLGCRPLKNPPVPLLTFQNVKNNFLQLMRPL